MAQKLFKRFSGGKRLDIFKAIQSKMPAAETPQMTPLGASQQQCLLYEGSGHVNKQEESSKFKKQPPGSSAIPKGSSHHYHNAGGRKGRK